MDEVADLKDLWLPRRRSADLVRRRHEPLLDEPLNVQLRRAQSWPEPRPLGVLLGELSVALLGAAADLGEVAAGTGPGARSARAKTSSALLAWGFHDVSPYRVA